MNPSMNGSTSHWFEHLDPRRWLHASPLRKALSELRLAETELRAKKAKRALATMEADPSVSDFWLTGYLEVLDQFKSFTDQPYVINSYYDRRYGANFPFWINEAQLSLIRAQARQVCTRNSYAVGLLTGLTSYVIGPGFTYRATSDESPQLAKDVQKEIDLFCRRNRWSLLEQELFWRSREDGEFFVRYFESDDRVLIVRTIEPEQIREPSWGNYREWSFGILTDPEDVVETFAYYVRYLDDAAYHDSQEGEEVPADEVVHFKCNVKRSIKRGLTDFSFDVYDALRAASKIRYNAGESAAVQSAIAQIRQWETATQTAIDNFTSAQTDFTRTNPVTGSQTNFHQVEPGAIVDVPRGMAYVPPPGSAPGVMQDYEIILHAQLRAAGTRWNAPEWIATASGADMAAYTASLTAENPFVKTATRFQRDYEEAFEKVIRKAISVAIDAGRLPTEASAVDIQSEGPALEAENDLQEAQSNVIRVQNGWKSKQTVAQEEGLDWELEQQNIEDYNERFGGMGLQQEPGEPAGSKPQPAQLPLPQPVIVESRNQPATQPQPMIVEVKTQPAIIVNQPASPPGPIVLNLQGQPAAVIRPDPDELPGASCDLAEEIAQRLLANSDARQRQDEISGIVTAVTEQITVVTRQAVTEQVSAATRRPSRVVRAEPDSVRSIERDLKGRIRRLIYSSGRREKIMRDRDGRIREIMTEQRALIQPGAVKTLLMMRHGETALNDADPHKDRIRGWKDVPLTAAGVKQANEVARFLRSLPVRRIATSDLQRARDTAAIIAAEHRGVSVEETITLRPWNVGVFTGEIASLVHDSIIAYARDKPAEQIPGRGESFDHFKGRTLGQIKQWMTESGDELMVIVSHFRNMKLVQSWLKADPLAESQGAIDIDEFALWQDMPTGVILQLECDQDGQWTARETGPDAPGRGS